MPMDGKCVSTGTHIECSWADRMLTAVTAETTDDDLKRIVSGILAMAECFRVTISADELTRAAHGVREDKRIPWRTSSISTAKKIASEIEQAIVIALQVAELEIAADMSSIELAQWTESAVAACAAACRRQMRRIDLIENICDLADHWRGRLRNNREDDEDEEEDDEEGEE